MNLEGRIQERILPGEMFGEMAVFEQFLPIRISTVISDFQSKQDDLGS